ncbi:hypothetical protein CLV48_11449 [Cecembia rubra]|uniref:Uncharacterized protein n=1 Tax=Cecembia rubra TaxID=1485585 RepID=A0A2P8DVQ0_9BACT|nr:hypothetical protein CLV48_11449 [Cecembia rubra]
MVEEARDEKRDMRHETQDIRHKTQDIRLKIEKIFRIIYQVGDRGVRGPAVPLQRSIGQDQNDRNYFNYIKQSKL